MQTRSGGHVHQFARAIPSAQYDAVTPMDHEMHALWKEQVVQADEDKNSCSSSLQNSSSLEDGSSAMYRLNFGHGNPTPDARWQQGCPWLYFTQEGCRHGSACRFLHDLNPSEVAMLQSTHNANCHMVFSTDSRYSHSGSEGSIRSENAASPVVWPADDTARISKVSLAQHNNGTCRPCYFFARPGSCFDGAECRFCHYDHTTAERSAQRAKLRPCKGKRDRQRKLMDRLTKELQANPSLDVNECELPKSLSKNEGLRKMFIDRLLQNVEAQDSLEDAVPLPAPLVPAKHIVSL